jgi:hypothetical protein
LIVAISEENGLESFEIVDRSFNSESFKKFIDKLHKMNEKRRIVLFMD